MSRVRYACDTQGLQVYRIRTILKGYVSLTQGLMTHCAAPGSGSQLHGSYTRWPASLPDHQNITGMHTLDS